MLDCIIRGGHVIDGTGAPARLDDVGIQGDRVETVGDLSGVEAQTVVDATGQVVSPGFVNMLSHAYYSLLQDPRGMSDLLQGVTTEVFSEEPPTGPSTPEMLAMTQAALTAAGQEKVTARWTDYAGYTQALEERRPALNACSFISTWQPWLCVMGMENRRPSGEEMNRMTALIEQQMEMGTFGIGSALIYPPPNFIQTDELVAFCRAAGRHGGRYHSHIRSEGNGLFGAFDELLQVGREADVPIELHHLKIAGRDNWPRVGEFLGRLEKARAEQDVSVNMYTFAAGGTALHASIPAAFHAGGLEGLRKRLADSAFRAEVRAVIEGPPGDWENLYAMSGGPEGVLLLSTHAPSFRPLLGKTIAEIAADLGKDPLEVLFDIVQQDEIGPGAAYFIISEDNIRQQVQLPFVAFGSDAEAAATEDPFTREPTHPRTYANFARLLQVYVRELGLVTVEDAVRRLTSLPCQTLGLSSRGTLAPSYYADIAVWDPAAVTAPATFAEPHRYSTGVRDVFVNGRAALRDGKPTDDHGGRVLRRGLNN